ncbi:hypothetical protein H5P28_15675 [Ruficoccus amylovorans]|uniref:DUF4384 domain-containing protein n=1 Tax=Ruficoccus amylovorans TaxID=1804625 RepID=A0A842HJF1_9BACT|nr:hypothetical protein [Ruficoccus amylovorans]MBC2595706.1 hypothetical protein [Ruficoccus amylovorans]
MTPFRWFHHALCAFLLFSLGSASHPASAQQQENVRRELKFLSWEGPIFELEMMQSSGSEPVIIPNGSPTYNTPYKGPSIARFGVTKTAPDGTEYFDTRASASLPQTDKPILLIFIPAPDGSYKVVAIPEENQTPVKGSFRVINVTNERFFIRIGDEQFEIPRGGSRLVQAAEKDSKSFPVQMVMEEDGSLRRVYSARWALIPERQITAFLFNDPETRKFALKRFVE